MKAAVLQAFGSPLAVEELPDPVLGTGEVSAGDGGRLRRRPGRNEKVLADVARRFGRRVRTVVLGGSEEDDRERMRRAAPGPIDCVLDLLPPSAGPVRAAAMTVRQSGRVVLMGGVSTGLELPYPWIMRNNVTIRGQWMYAREAVRRIVSLVRAGLLELTHYDVTAFELDHANDAIAHAAANSVPFKLTVIPPADRPTASARKM